MLKVFSIFDSKAAAYMQPFFSVNKAVAIRSFSQAAQDESGQFKRHAEDYTLFFIGEWDEQSGELTSRGEKVALGTALEFIAQMGD